MIPKKVWIHDKKLYIIFLKGNTEYTVPLAGVTVNPGQEQVARECINVAAEFSWRIGASNPVTNDSGEVQVRVVYEMDGATRDLSLTIGDAILESSH